MKNGIIHAGIMIVCILLLFAAGMSLYADESLVLIANQGSEFKNAVVEKLREEMKGSGVSFAVQKLNILSRASPDEWDAVVILHAVKMGSINKNVERFLNRVNDPSRVIVCTTCGQEDVIPGKYGIDSITAASKVYEIEAAVTRIAEQLRGVLGI